MSVPAVQSNARRAADEVDEAAVQVGAEPLLGLAGAQERLDQTANGGLDRLDVTDLVLVRVEVVAVVRHRLGELRVGPRRTVEIQQIVGVLVLDGHGEAEVLDADVAQPVEGPNRPVEAILDAANVVVGLGRPSMLMRMVSSG